jgi:hypothetical protein
MKDEAREKIEAVTETIRDEPLRERNKIFKEADSELLDEATPEFLIQAEDDVFSNEGTRTQEELRRRASE